MVDDAGAWERREGEKRARTATRGKMPPVSVTGLGWAGRAAGWLAGWAARVRETDGASGWAGAKDGGVEGPEGLEGPEGGLAACLHLEFHCLARWAGLGRLGWGFLTEGRTGVGGSLR